MWCRFDAWSSHQDSIGESVWFFFLTHVNCWWPVNQWLPGPLKNVQWALINLWVNMLSFERNGAKIIISKLQASFRSIQWKSSILGGRFMDFMESHADTPQFLAPFFWGWKKWCIACLLFFIPFFLCQQSAWHLFEVPVYITRSPEFRPGSLVFGGEASFSYTHIKI